MKEVTLKQHIVQATMEGASAAFVLRFENKREYVVIEKHLFEELRDGKSRQDNED